MRKWHRWLSILFGVFALWIVTTGLLSQLVPIVQRGGFEAPAPPPPAALPPGFTCPETLTCRPKPQGRSLVGTIHHLHSGETFGPVGQIVLILTGFALLFFAVSGLWMYVDLFRARTTKGRNGRKVRGGRFFWD